MFLIDVIFVVCIITNAALANKGCVQLDTYSFDKVTSKFEAALIKFDTMYPYGDKHDAFEAVCEAAYSSPDLIVGEVQVRDYGDRDNEDLAARFGIGKDDYPAVRLFVKGKDEPIAFRPAGDSEFTANNLKRFLRSKSGVYIGLPGCLESFDKLAAEFVLSEDDEKRKTILKDAEATWDDAKGHREIRSAETYVKIMRKVMDKGLTFVSGETSRVANLLKGKLSGEKQIQMQERLNILQSFSRHDEL